MLFFNICIFLYNAICFVIIFKFHINHNMVFQLFLVIVFAAMRTNRLISLVKSIVNYSLK